MGIRRVSPLLVDFTLRVSRSTDWCTWMTPCSRSTASHASAEFEVYMPKLVALGVPASAMIGLGSQIPVVSIAGAQAADQRRLRSG
jgi:hypothetical protein